MQAIQKSYRKRNSSGSSSSRSRSRSPPKHKRKRSSSGSSSGSPKRRSHRSRSLMSSRSRRSRSNSDSRSHHSRRRSGSREPIPIRPIANNEPKYINRRIFVGNLPSKNMVKEDLTKHFEPYGTIVDTLLHPGGYGFVQFLREEDARKAAESEHGSLIKGYRLDVNMAAEGKTRRGRERFGHHDGPPHRDDLPPPEGYRNGPPRPRPPPGRERSPMREPYPPYDDPYRDPYRNSRDLPPPPRRDDPYYDPYRRGPYPPPAPAPAPYYDPYREDPYRRDPYYDPYRDYERRPPPPPVDDFPPPRKLPTECEIVTTNKTLLDYGRAIEKRLKPLDLVTEVIVIPEERTLPQQIEDASLRKILFAVVVNSQNEVHQSLTLNILHGAPEEHRNMPLEDAIKLVAKSFEKYLETQRAKLPAPAPAPATPAVAAAPLTKAPFLPASKEVGYLLNLLADNRHLTLEEMDKIMGYLRERRDHLVRVEGGHSVQAPLSAPAPAAAPAPAPAPAPRTVDPVTAQSLQEHEQLQSKILSILNGSSPGMSASAASTLGSILAAQPKMEQAPQPASTPAAGSALINFDNPNVQKAIDNLIQSGPNLLRNISAATSSAPSSQSSTVSHAGAGLGQHAPPMYAPQGQPSYAPPPPPSRYPPHY